jgi:RNA polymerase sigma factor (sigma-70 family)
MPAGGAMADTLQETAPAVDVNGRLLARARTGDVEALNALFAAHLPVLRRWASGRLPRWARDIADTTDLVQDTAMDALRHLDHFEDRGEGALQAYLRQAVVNRIRNALRWRSRHGVPEVLSPSLPGDAASPLELVIGRQTLDQYDAALQRLSAGDREAIVARVEFRLDYHGVAVLLGKPSANAARMAVVRALVRLADEMRRAGIVLPAGPHDA